MAASPCPLDTEFANQIAVLLTPPSPQTIKEYYDELLRKEKCLAVRIETNKECGKGVFSNREFKKEEVIFKDQMLVAAQHGSNKIECLVCSSCFRFIGSVEHQIGRNLYLQSLGLSDKKACDHQSFPDDTTTSSLFESQNEDDLFLQGNKDAGQSSCTKNSLAKEVLELLMNGNLSLPYSKQFVLPPIISCPGGCEEEHYCSKACADSDWKSIHSLLCTGKSSDSWQQTAVVKFTEHANRTNDIFILAAKVISFTVLRYRRLKRSHFEDIKKSSILHNSTNESNLLLLLEAWKPVSMGFKRRWWDCIALPDDVDSSDEALFRKQIRDLAFSSLQLLKQAIFDIECAPLFSLEVYGHIVGMFELNNLDLVVASPVEDYFIYVDDLLSPEKEETEKLTRPFLDALGDDYSVYCQGTAFFPIQSCMNHSCCPNAKAFKREEDRDGQAVIIAVGPISKGEEITISYIDEDLPYEERQALLADYGFKCTCQKCRNDLSSL